MTKKARPNEASGRLRRKSLCQISHNMPPSRALRCPQTRTVAVSDYELHLLAETLEANAARAAVNSETIATASAWFERAAELREVAR